MIGNFTEETNEPITVEFLKEYGFEVSDINKHVYDVQAGGEYFQILKYKDEGKNVLEEFKHLNHKDFIILFYTYYDDVIFYDFKYQHQILNLYYCLTGKQLVKVK
jgi:hypothetical protein